MDLRVQKRTLEFIYNIVDNKANNINFIKYKPQKETFMDNKPYVQPFLRSTPEEQGISSQYIANFFNELSNEEDLNPHTIMILRNGKVIAEGSFSPYKTDMWHVTHSLCKSIIGIAIGMLIDDKLLNLDDKIVKILEKYVNPLISLKKKTITIEHLLTMSTGIVFNETGAVTEDNWIKSYLESNLRFEPGEKFAYNSMNSYILSVIIKEVSGKGVMEFLQERLWKPLGIEKIFWEQCPNGIEKGGWGLYMLPEDMAKVGQLLLQQGIWNGKQLVSKEWISKMTSKKIDTPKEMGKYGYGYQVWISARKNSYQFNGMLGQNVIVYPDINMVIVTTAGNSELFQHCRIMNLIEKYFAGNFMPKDKLPKDNREYKNLLKIEKNLGTKYSKWPLKQYYYNKLVGLIGDKLPKECKDINGKAYKMDSSPVGIIPLFIQALHNNYSKGIEKISFAINESKFYIIIKEGEEIYSLEVGFNEAIYNEITINKEPYIIACLGKFTTDEDDTLVLKLAMPFIETSNTRFLKVFFYKDKIITEWNESPGMNLILEGIDSVVGALSKNNFINNIVSKGSSDYIMYKIRSSIEPRVCGKIEGGVNING